MKVLFLDVDGVLNSRVKPSFMQDGLFGMHPDHVAELVRIVEATDCHIVVSSAWRQGGIGPNSLFATTLKGFGGRRAYARVFDRTGVDSKGRRGVEILRWIAANCIGLDGSITIEQYAVLDDESVESGLDQSRLFRTDAAIGLTPEIADKVISHLNGASEAA